MISETATIINKLGLHARAAAKFVGVANRFNSIIHLKKENKSADGKSIMSVMMLAASKGAELTISAEGDDEQDAVIAIKELIKNRFDENE